MADEDRIEEPGPVRPRDDGQLHFAPETAGRTFPVAAPAETTPLGDEPEGTVPATPLWALKERRHGTAHLFGHPARLRAVAGTGDAAVYAVEDGADHCMIGRVVGSEPGGCTYSLVARVDRSTWDALAAGRIDGRAAFAASTDAGLSGTVEGGGAGLGNVFDVDWYPSPADIPAEYLPPSPAVAFTAPLPTADR